MIYRTLFDRLATRLDAERAHRLGFGAVRAGAPLIRVGDRLRPFAPDPVRAMGIDFRNRLGLAAGFDKNAEDPTALARLGFGHVEVGTVTGLAQPGNPTPRLFRLPDDRAVVNRMGFNNQGADAVAHRLRGWRERNPFGGTAAPGGPPVLGINIGKSKVVPEDDAEAVARDYESSTRQLAPLADYLVVNVSSPNTPGLRNLQATERLEPLLLRVRAEADRAVERAGGVRRVPLLVKIAPDLADEDVDAVAELALTLGLDGMIATNTTISRDGLSSTPAEIEAVGAGGLSGAPLTRRSTEVVRRLRDRVGAGMTLIGVGGIGTPEEARERLAAGADLIQAYSAFIYQGPLWPRRILTGLREQTSGDQTPGDQNSGDQTPGGQR